MISYARTTGQVYSPHGQTLSDRAAVACPVWWQLVDRVEEWAGLYAFVMQAVHHVIPSSLVFQQNGVHPIDALCPNHLRGMRDLTAFLKPFPVFSGNPSLRLDQLTYPAKLS